MRDRRSTLRGVLVILAAALLAGPAAASPRAGGVPSQIIFPVVGPYRYTNDFGDPRPQGRHEGNDILAPKHSPVVAVEDGKIKFWTTSSRAGCMLYLYGASGTTYLYIHLNNDVTMANDNRGKCVAGGSYWPGLKDGAKVVAGQAIGFVGDSGDADGIQPHLHFEVRTPSGRAIDPYPYLNKATRLLYPRPVSDNPISLAFRKATVIETDTDTLTVKTTRIRVSTWEADYARSRQVVLSVAPTAMFERVTSTGRSALTLSGLRTGMVVWVGTAQFVPSWATQRAAASDLSLEHLTLR
jgi:hypothetical protein